MSRGRRMLASCQLRALLVPAILFIGIFRYSVVLAVYKPAACFPLPIILRNILIMGEVGMDAFGNLEYPARITGMMNLLKFAVIVVASVPVLALYPFVQRSFVKGIMSGSIKG
jgi:putative aldouronate transport system permease protein